MAACITTKALTYPEGLTSSPALLCGAEGNESEGTVDLCCPLCYRRKTTRAFRRRSTGGFGSEESESSHRAGGMTISSYVGDEREREI